MTGGRRDCGGLCQAFRPAGGRFRGGRARGGEFSRRFRSCRAAIRGVLSRDSGISVRKACRSAVFRLGVVTLARDWLATCAPHN